MRETEVQMSSENEGGQRQTRGGWDAGTGIKGGAERGMKEEVCVYRCAWGHVHGSNLH